MNKKKGVLLAAAGVGLGIFAISKKIPTLWNKYIHSNTTPIEVNEPKQKNSPHQDTEEQELKRKRQTTRKIRNALNENDEFNKTKRETLDNLPNSSSKKSYKESISQNILLILSKIYEEDNDNFEVLVQKVIQGFKDFSEKYVKEVELEMQEEIELCGYCRGTGWKTCPDCHGDQYIGTSECNTCDGEGEISCHCNFK